MSDDEDSSEYSGASRRKSRKHGERKGSHKRKRRHKEERRRDRRKRHKDRKERDDDSRKRRRKHRHRKRIEDESVTGGERKKADSGVLSKRDDAISQALCSLLEDRPVLSGELPIILIRLAGGAAFDLRQMTDTTAADRLEQVFVSLQIFGVQRQMTNNHWIFRNPNKQTGSDELILLRIIRTVLDESGVTMQSVENYENERAKQERKTPNAISEESKQNTSNDLQPVKTATVALLEEFKSLDSNLGQQLIVLCRSILEGECLCIDGLPNEFLRDRLASIFLLCGLEKSEMEDTDSDDDNSRGEVTMGYNLPEDADETVKLKLHAFMDECRRPTEKPQRRLVGPQRPQCGNAANSAVSDDDEGPLPVGSIRRRSTIPSIRPEISNGDSADVGKEKREEWMLVPGKNDFLSSIKSGQSIKSRGFKNEKQPTRPIEEDIHPEIRREIDCINAAHNEARGPSLMSQHRSRKQKEEDEKNTEEKEKFKWSRDRDLDSGRRVDKNALKMILGGAASDLQSKFQGTYNK
mmetsp:Transcript_20559/g.50451  ORF Transcript_20559/g.50451 Transcript_20559/m.50451 type:complete len:523 (-) Transcript_20559:3415-4983(-)